MALVTILGFIAGLLTSISLLPQVIRTWKLKKTKDISLWAFIILNIGVALWLIYGLLINDLPLIAANGVGLALASTVLFFKIKYG